MNRNFSPLYFLFGCVFAILLALLYWSSVLMERDLKELKSDITDLKREILDKLSSPPPSSASASSTSEEIAHRNGQPAKRPHIDPNLPNLLEEDPFYSITLPKLLGPNFKPQGIRHEATLGRPENLHPFSGWAEPMAWTRLCLVSVARLQFGKFETFAPDMAIKVEERVNATTGKKEFWIHLREGVYWQPLRQDFFSQTVQLSPHFLKKHPVTAEDFKFLMDAVMNPYVQELGALAIRTVYQDLEEIEVVDPLTFIVRWKGKEFKDAEGNIVVKTKYSAKSLTGGLYPLASFVYKYFPDGSKIIEDDSDPSTYKTNSVWAQNFSHHWAKQIIASCGPWIFNGMNEEGIRFKRNPDHYFPYEVLAEALEIKFKNTPDAMFNDFKTNRTDIYYVQPEQLAEFQRLQEQQPADSPDKIEQLPFLFRAYYYLGWNEAKPFFKNKKIRQALTMAIDRSRIIRQNLNGMGIEITGTFYPTSTEYDTSVQPWPYDPQKAKAMLEEEGWFDRNGDGIVEGEVDGIVLPFRFSLTYYVRNSTAKAIAEYVATALKEIGIQTDLNGVDTADLSAAFEGKSFDAIYLGWSLGTPPSDPRQLWYSTGAKEPGSSNGIGFANAEVDHIIDALDYEDDPQKRIELYHQFSKIIHEEAPYTFLYASKRLLGYHKYVQEVFIPAERQDLIPGADIGEPQTELFWIKK